jgi:Na+/H+-dicarboxylate symporter
VLGILIGEGAQIAFGMVIGAALGLIIGAVVQAQWSSQRDR